jgi:hypothetical protein
MLPSIFASLGERNLKKGIYRSRVQETWEDDDADADTGSTEYITSKIVV